MVDWGLDAPPFDRRPTDRRSRRSTPSRSPSPKNATSAARTVMRGRGRSVGRRNRCRPRRPEERSTCSWTGKEPGSRVTLAFLGGEPLANRAVIRDATALCRAPSRRRVACGAVLDHDQRDTRDRGRRRNSSKSRVSPSRSASTGSAKQHDLLRPFRDGSGSYTGSSTRSPALALHAAKDANLGARDGHSQEHRPARRCSTS